MHLYAKRLKTNAMRKSLFLSFIFISTLFLSFAQRFNYDETSKVYFGFNIGRTWHTSDVQNVNDRFPLGAGFIFGTSLNQNYGNALSFDLRLRYLGGAWYGQDTDTTGNIGQNTAVSNIYDTLGYATQNFRAGQHRLALELAIHFNRFRERTGIDPYIFGGIGLTATRTKSDLLNNGLPYDYDLNPSGDQIAEDYATPLDLNSAGDAYDETEYETNFLPSLGVGLGYYFNSRFSIGLEHKSTFFLDDYFDGTAFNQDGIGSTPFENDIYHYTSVYFRWYLRARSNQVTEQVVETPDNTTNIDNYTTTPDANLPPVVRFTNPSNSPHTTDATTFTLRANVNHVNSSNDVTFRQDGEVNHDFTYNPITDLFQSTVQLRPGQNIFRIRGVNQDGSDEATMIIIQRREDVSTPMPPVVTITDPSSNPQTVNQTTYTVRATIENVSNAQNVTVQFNGSPFTGFTFNPVGTNNFSANLNLNAGVNTITITGTNNDGMASDQTTLIYNRAPKIDPPIVNFTNPAISPITVNTNQFNLTGTVERVSGRNNVSFTQNGANNNNFSFNANSTQFTSNVILSPGQNIFTLKGTNDAGMDLATVIINYEVEQPKPPIVSILNPFNDPHVTYDASQPFQASVLNVTSQNQVSMTVNGGNFTNFTFNPSTGVLTSVLPLQIGTNVVVVTGTNNDGTDSDQTTIIYRKPTQPQPPLVDYVVPSSNPYQTFDNTQLINATVLNVNNSNQVDVKLNGAAVTNFSFNTTTKLVSFTASLIEGVNTVAVTGTNNDGVDSETMTIIYKKREKPVLPIVSFIDPIVNPKTVYAPVYNVTAKVQYVDGPNSINLTINGNNSTNFTYSTTSQLMTFNASLNPGANTIQIKGTNDYGQDMATTAIIYKRSNVINPPQVNIVLPIADPHTTVVSTQQVQATVLNVSGPQQITVSLNGTNVQNFAYNNVTKLVSFTANLVQGNNDVIIAASNSAGTDTDNMRIIYDKQEVINPPLVTFTNPPSSGYLVNTPGFQMVAEVENVTSKNQIEVRFNGSIVNSGLYNFNAQTKEVTYNVSLTGGNNLFQVRGTNTAGTHQATTNVIYKATQVDCDNPEVTFIDPANSGITVNQDFYTVKAILNHVDSQNDIELKVNGFAINSFMYNAASHVLTRKVDLMEGGNVVEIIATNDCGEVDETILINYVIPDAPCVEPEISPINPASLTHNTENANVDLIAGISNIENATQVQLTVNGSPTNFSFDPGTNQIAANIALAEGNNTIVVNATNDCGQERLTWTINRTICKEPVINLTTTPSDLSNAIPNEELIISGIITHATASNIGVLFNGSPVNFVYDETTGSFSLTLQLNEGQNTVNIKVTNNCGTTKEDFSVMFKPARVPAPPTVEITSPSANPHTTNNSSISVSATTTNINTMNQVSVTVNGTPANFMFDAAANTITFNTGLQEGSNNVTIVVVNADGTADDQTEIVYNKPVVVKPPIVSFTDPNVSPMQIAAGSYTINGFVEHIDAPSQLQILVNQQPYTAHTTSVQPTGVAFQLNVTVNPANPSYTVTAIGTNSAGSDQGSVVIELDPATINCRPRLGAQFSADHKSSTAVSNMPIDNVVLKFSDQTTQTFNGLSGTNETVSGTGANLGKCILGAWVKSGCNESGDGPNYGTWFPNVNYDGSCEQQPCDTPVMSLVSATSSSSANYSFQVFVDHVTANEVSITHNGQPVNCNYNSTNQIFGCTVVLTEDNNTFVVTANACETVSETYTINYEIPCTPIAYSRIYPASAAQTVTDDNITITLNAQHSENAQVSVNGANYTNYSIAGNQISLNNVPLNEGANSIQVNLSNDCSQETISYAVTYDAPQTCGPRINPGNSAWEFCLITPSGTYTRDDLANNLNFSYTGPASSLYFKAIAGGGDALVGGNNYAIQSGRYYLFQGVITVSVSTSHPGSMGHWQVCIDADRAPQSGNGGNRPPSPCANKSNTGGDSNPRGTINRTISPNNSTQPSRTKPSRNTNEGGTEKAPTQTKPTRGTIKKSGGSSTGGTPQRQPTRSAPTRGTGGGRQ